jgi:hypothetical protein
MLCNLYQYIYLTRITTRCDLKPNTLAIYIFLQPETATLLTDIGGISQLFEAVTQVLWSI